MTLAQLEAEHAEAVSPNEKARIRSAAKALASKLGAEPPAWSASDAKVREQYEVADLRARIDRKAERRFRDAAFRDAVRRAHERLARGISASRPPSEPR